MHCRCGQYEVLQVVVNYKSQLYSYSSNERNTRLLIIMIIFKSIFIKAVLIKEKQYVQISFADYIPERK